jgi:NAD-dependent dihydropyrimidine dehydrogenase PreA subunit
MDGEVMVKLIIDEAKCNGCGDCVKVCKSRSLEIRDGVCVATKPDECKLCMLCKVTCPERAIEIEV